jgi:hypothetical protein
LAVGEHDGAPLILSAGRDGALRNWRLAPPLTAMVGAVAYEVKVRDMSIGSLQIVMVLPPDLLTAAGVTAGLTASAGAVLGLTKLLDAIKRVAGFSAELRVQALELELEQQRLATDLLEAEERLLEAEARARQRRRNLQAAGYELERVVVSDEDDQYVL